MTAKRIPLSRARKGLALVWLLGGGAFLLLLVIQSLTGTKLGGQVQGVWSWALPTILPVLSLVLSVLGYEALREKPVPYTVDRTFLLITYVLSVFYLGLVLVTVLLEPLLTPYETPLELFQMSNLWLGPFQALVISALGVLFFQSRTSHDREEVGAGASAGEGAE